MIATDPSVLDFNGTRFNSVELNGELWLRADELGKAAGLEPPESALLGLYDAHADQMPLRLTALAGVETPDGPRLMRVFNPLGAYAVLTFMDTPGVRLIRRWLLETLAYLQIDVKREIARLTEQDERLWACFEALSKEVRELREAHAARNDRDWMEGEFRRWHEAQAETAATVKKLSTRIGAREPRRGAALEDIAALLRACVDPLADGMADLHERIETLAAESGREGSVAALGDGVPVLTLPSHYSLAFRSDHGDRLTVGFWRDGGPWFYVQELADLLAPAEEHRRDIGGFVTARIPAAHRATAYDSDGGEVHLVTETGLALLFRAWTETMSDFDKRRLGRWIADQVIPSALSLRLRETELEPEHRPKDFPAAPTEVLADRLFKVYAGDLDGRPAALVKARDLYKFLGFRQSYSSWFDEQSRWAGLRQGVHYLRPYVASFRYDHYLTLDAASGLLCQESHPRAIEARDYLMAVARERAGVIEGEAVRVSEGKTLNHFTYEPDGESLQIRALVIKDQTWLVASDIAKALNYRDAEKMTRMLDEEEKDTRIVGTPGGPQKMTIINESGFYHAVLKSSKPEAKRFRNWVTADVLPTLRRTGRYDMQGASSHAAPADTPPHQPLSIPFKRGNRDIPVRVAVRHGKPWFLAFDLALAVDGKSEDPRPAFAGVPDAYRGLWPSPDGDSAALWLDEAGLAYYLGGRPHKPAAEALRDWLQGEARDALRNRPGTMPEGQPSAPVPPEDRHTHRDPLYLACLAVAERLFRAEAKPRRGGSAVSDNYGRLLAWLWRNAPGEGWLPVGNASHFAGAVGLSRRSLARAVERAAAWGLAEQCPERPDGWPTEIRPIRARLAAALDATGMEWRA